MTKAQKKSKKSGSGKFGSFPNAIAWLKDNPGRDVLLHGLDKEEHSDPTFLRYDPTVEDFMLYSGKYGDNSNYLGQIGWLHKANVWFEVVDPPAPITKEQELENVISSFGCNAEKVRELLKFINLKRCEYA